MPPSVRSALGLKREGEEDDEEEEEMNCFDVYPVEQFWGSPFCMYYIKGHELGLDGWYVVEIRLMREKWSAKSSPLVWREYVVATVAKTETRDPTGNGYLCFERSEERGPIPETLEGLEEPDRERETEIFVDKKPYTGRPYPKDHLKYLSYVRNPAERYKYVDRVRILANPWLHRDDVTVAFLEFPPPELGKAQPKTLQGNSMIKAKCKWLFVSDLVYIARQLNRQRELFYIFPRTAHWLAGMMIHVVRIWTCATVRLYHRNGKQSIKVAPGMDMVAWQKSLRLAAERDERKDKSRYDFDDVLRVVKLPKNYTIRTLVEQYWHYCTTADIIGMFAEIEMQERNHQIEEERRFNIQLAAQQKKVQDAIQRIRVMKDRESRRKKVDRRMRMKEVKKTPQQKLKEIKEKRVLRWNERAVIGGPKSVGASRTGIPKVASEAPEPSKPILLPKLSRPTDLNPGSYHLPPTKVWRSQQKAMKKAENNRKSLFRFSLEGPKSRFGLFKEREVDKERLKQKEKAKAEKEEKGNGNGKNRGKEREKRKEKDKEREKEKEEEKEKGKLEAKGKEPAKARETGKERMVKWLSSK